MVINWVPVKTAAKRLGVSRQRVHQLMKTGALRSCQMDGVHLVSMQSVECRINMREADKWNLKG